MKKILFLLLLLAFVKIHSQIVYEPQYKDVYGFLSRLGQKGIIQLDDQIKPLSKKYIAGKLLELTSKEQLLTGLEKEELAFYKKDYLCEISFIQPSDTVEENPGKVNLFGKDPAGRLRMFSCSGKILNVNVSPIVGYEKGSRDSRSYSHMWSGVYFYGYLPGNIGFSFDYRDNSENGVNIDTRKNFTPATGGIIKRSAENEIQYSEVRTTLSAGWSWGSAVIGKDFINWGYGESGRLVLSDKAPSFPFIRLDINPVEWLRFNYIHAWLNSDVVDSSETYSSYMQGGNSNRTVFRQKFLASHSLILTPFKGLDISLGESVVYSDRLEIVYLMPLMFYRLADHYLSRQNNNAGANSQFFAGISSRNHLKNTHLYGTIYIDEITISGLFDPEKQRTQIGFTLGGSAADIAIKNLTATLEFTKAYPFVYKHYIPTQTYANSGYTMGHWMGDNADLVYGSLNYRFLRGLQATLWGEYIRKGEYDFSEGVELQYGKVQPPFLFGRRNNYTWGGLDVKYELTHELFARARFIYNNASRQQASGSFQENKTNEFYLSLYYGL